MNQPSKPAQNPLALLWDRALRFQSFFGLVAIFALAVIWSPRARDGSFVFLKTGNLLNIIRFASENGIIAIGMTLVILTGGIDLSVGSLMALCAVGAAYALMKMGLGTVATVLLVLGIGGLAGLINGAVTTQLRIQSFISTLAMMTAARGIASLWSKGYAIPLAFGPGAAPPSYKSVFAGELPILGGIPVQILYFIGIGAVTGWVLQRTTFGRHVYAVGSSESASRLSGLAVNRIKMIVFSLSGFMCGVAALLHSALVNQGSHIDGNGYELNAIAAVVIGGTSLMGGSGTVLGSIVGALILSILDNILGLLGKPSEFQAIAKGVIIVIAVVLQRRKGSG